MRLAIKEAVKSLKTLGGGPFGSCIVKSGKVIAVAGNTVFKKDATCHAEINAIRIASKKLGTYDLSGCFIYTTTEPCPMCFSAIHWSGISCIIFGTRIADAARAGFNELPISARSLKRQGRASVKIISGFLARDCGKLFKDWKNLEGKKEGLINHASPYFAKGIKCRN
ncbi:MAG: nucleoside deaminase [Candidatus Omnitrophica bacterium]|nr:nucleoside deaminase [Candidatus Omnitrophota bacterium]